jgi:hypothetical protein
MSTEPGWMVAGRRAFYYLGAGRTEGRNNPSMLLSFERPASAGVREDVSQRRDRIARGRPA